ncbi:nucleoside diphosphate kinase regulator [Cesiribacter andamanensis]|uniref:Regulator of nucleoside diphosphate kinase n=1 Tax=Cesiribacter andamanensis AMV16 TaxID=1279009 RepID=M7N7R9_9BACT|nr:nucleoside diphosphate kinase regulator [Cesiribacter andamanensis]EMR03256.1 Regulator of nucleoside diphosphate kinase [Cesiribacter andamanensis AMV16]
MKEVQTLIVNSLDKKRLSKLFPVQQSYAELRDNIKLLEEKLGTAKTLTAKKVPPTVVTMNSRVEVKNLSLGRAMAVELVYPDAVDAARFKISIFSPLGAAIFGYSQGDEFLWAGRSGKNRFRIEKVLYQPESAGDYHL